MIVLNFKDGPPEKPRPRRPKSVVRNVGRLFSLQRDAVRREVGAPGAKRPAPEKETPPPPPRASKK